MEITREEHERAVIKALDPNGMYTSLQVAELFGYGKQTERVTDLRRAFPWIAIQTGRNKYMYPRKRIAELIDKLSGEDIHDEEGMRIAKINAYKK